jgi:hypothetical protein
VEPRPGLAEAAEMWWRPERNARFLRRQEWTWTAWTAAVIVSFVAPSALIVWLEPLTIPIAALFVSHALLITRLQAGRGWRQVSPIDGPLGLLGDLLGHRERELAGRTGLAIQKGTLGIWLVGAKGALLVRPSGRRVDCFCVRVAEDDGLGDGDRVAHLLLALREDELGFATVANLGFSGARWRVQGRMPTPVRPALDAARKALR